jgi:hypothetical protein
MTYLVIKNKLLTLFSGFCHPGENSALKSSNFLGFFPSIVAQQRHSGCCLSGNLRLASALRSPPASCPNNEATLRLIFYQLLPPHLLLPSLNSLLDRYHTCQNIRLCLTRVLCSEFDILENKGRLVYDQLLRRHCARKSSEETLLLHLAQHQGGSIPHVLSSANSSNLLH